MHGLCTCSRMNQLRISNTLSEKHEVKFYQPKLKHTYRIWRKSCAYGIRCRGRLSVEITIGRLFSIQIWNWSANILRWFSAISSVLCAANAKWLDQNLSFKLILRVNKNILVIQSVLLHHGSGQFDRVPIEIQLAHFFSCLLEHNNKYINYLTWFISVIDFQLEWKKAEKNPKSNPIDSHEWSFPFQF